VVSGKYRQRPFFVVVFLSLLSFYPPSFFLFFSADNALFVRKVKSSYNADFVRADFSKKFLYRDLTVTLWLSNGDPKSVAHTNGLHVIGEGELLILTVRPNKCSTVLGEKKKYGKPS